MPKVKYSGFDELCLPVRCTLALVSDDEELSPYSCDTATAARFRYRWGNPLYLWGRRTHVEEAIVYLNWRCVVVLEEMDG